MEGGKRESGRGRERKGGEESEKEGKGTKEIGRGGDSERERKIKRWGR